MTKAKSKKRKSKKLQPTLFLMKDERQGEDAKFKRYSRPTYKAAARKCSEQGLAFRTGTEYRHGRAVKMLTILDQQSRAT